MAAKTAMFATQRHATGGHAVVTCDQIEQDMAVLLRTIVQLKLHVSRRLRVA